MTVAVLVLAMLAALGVVWILVVGNATRRRDSPRLVELAKEGSMIATIVLILASAWAGFLLGYGTACVMQIAAKADRDFEIANSKRTVRTSEIYGADWVSHDE